MKPKQEAVSAQWFSGEMEDLEVEQTFKMLISIKPLSFKEPFRRENNWFVHLGQRTAHLFFGGIFTQETLSSNQVTI